MSDAQFQIFVKEVKDELSRDEWLRENGIIPNRVNQVALEVHQAQKIAKNLLTTHGNLMTQEQILLVQKFFKASRNHLLQHKLTHKTCNRIMNIGAGVNRKLFAKNKRANRKG